MTVAEAKGFGTVTNTNVKVYCPDISEKKVGFQVEPNDTNVNLTIIYSNL